MDKDTQPLLSPVREVKADEIVFATAEGLSKDVGLGTKQGLTGVPHNFAGAGLSYKNGQVVIRPTFVVA